MKTSVKRAIRDEKGTVMILALILLVVGGLIIAPLLGFMGTGLIAGQVYEKKTDELYAADTGVEDAIWKMQNDVVKPPQSCGDPDHWSYNISDVNGKSVAVTITWVNNTTNTVTYHIVSTATGDGSGTKIEAYVIGTTVYGDFSGITDNVITSLGEIDYPPIYEITYPEGAEPYSNYPPDYWPPGDELAAWYFEDVEDEEPYDSDTIDLYGVDQELGPIYRDGTLTIKNSSNTPATLTLTGTIYITGDTLIGTTGKDFTLDLNDNTIFVASDSADPQKALWIGGQCTLIGSGAIIAIGDIYFAPNTKAGVTDPVFIMSVEGTTTLQPGGDFYGSIAGSVEVQLQPDTSINYPEEGGFGVINFPGCTAGRFIYAIATWEVS